MPKTPFKLNKPRLLAILAGALIATAGTVVPATSASAAITIPFAVPSASTTGVPAGKVLKVHNGNMVIRTANTVIDGWEIRGTLRIDAPGAIIKNSKITGGTNAGNAGIVQNIASGAKFTIMDSEIYAATPSSTADGIFGSNFTALRVNIHHVIDPIRVLSSNVRIQDSWLHNNLHYLNDPAHGGGPSHDDSIMIQGGNNIVVTGNRLEHAHNAAIQIVQDRSRPQVSGVTISKNYLDGGGCTVNVAAGYFPGINITGNVFGPHRKYVHCPVIAGNNPTPTLTSNVWYLTGTIVPMVKR